MNKTCAKCGKPFTLKHTAQKYHPLCAYNVRLEKERERRAKNAKLRWSRFDGHEILLAKSSNLYEKNISKICRQQDHQNASQV